MYPPTEGSAVTPDQVAAALNIGHFPDAVPGNKAWHIGQFEPWSMSCGYPSGMPLYGNIGPHGHHIYWLPDRQATIILGLGQNPADYGC